MVMRLLLVMLMVGLLGNLAWGIGGILGETKEELKLKYEVVVSDPANGQVGVEFTLESAGRLGSIGAVELMIPKEDKSGSYDLTAPLALREENGKQVVRFNLKKEWAGRAEIWLTAKQVDGKFSGMERVHHVISVAKYFKKVEGR